MLSGLRNVLYSWRFYSLGRERYSENLNKLFSNNLLFLRQASMIAGIFTAVFSLFPLIIGQEVIHIFFYLAVSVISFLLAAFSNFKMQTLNVGNALIYTLIALFYTNVMLFGIYLSIWGGVGFSPIFFCLLISILLFFVSSPSFNLSLTAGAASVYLLSVIFIKGYENLLVYIVNVFIAGIIGLYFSWEITKLRLGLEYSSGQLEEERNKYLNQSTTDELTQLRNRRDFMQTFQRFLTNYRASDDWFCVACADIDFFKNYNDHYGHPQGDECLRSIGTALNNLRDIMGVYTARVGGEEFSVLWFEKEAAHVDAVIKKMIGLVRDLKIPHEKSKASKYVTMSIGVYVVRCGATTDVQTLYNLADKALYMAKGGGRNCAVVYGKEIKQYKITLSNEEKNNSRANVS